MSNLLKGTTIKDIESTDKIDKSNTYEIKFTLNNTEDCIKIKVSSYKTDEILNEKITLNTFFTVEKILDISNFNDPGSKITYSELDSNYDNNWKTKPEIIICSVNNPIKRLNKDDKFRIRFTAFQENNFSYEIIIQSDYGIKSEMAAKNK